MIGAPAIDPKVFFKAQAVMKKLPDMYRELGALRKEIEELKKNK
jgi:UDP-3-O-[3-hydroxymyristoyl] glucosamine N-acyltransferase